MICFIRSINSSLDSRLHRYIHAFNIIGIEPLVIDWCRGNLHLKSDPVRITKISCSITSRLGMRWSNLFNILFFNYFIFKNLFLNRYKFTYIHAVDLDTIVSATIFAKIFNKKIVFDIYDSYAESRDVKYLLKIIIDHIELFFSTLSDLVIIPDIIRRHQVSEKANVIIIENTPLPIKEQYLKTSISNTISLCYVGILEEKHRGLEDLISIVMKYPSKVNLTIAGFGPLTEFCSTAMKVSNNIIFLGPVSPKEALKLMSESDVMIGLYYSSKIHHKYATPNKYYEHLQLGRPLLTSINTPPGVKVLINNTGWAIDDGESSIEAFIIDISREELITCSQNASKIWQKEYHNYFQSVIVNEYCLGIKNRKY